MTVDFNADLVFCLYGAQVGPALTNYRTHPTELDCVSGGWIGITTVSVSITASR
jgi:hypothetical protein